MIGVHVPYVSPEDDNAVLRQRIEKLKVGKKALRNERDFLRRKHLEALAKCAELEAEIERLRDAAQRWPSHVTRSWVETLSRIKETREAGKVISMNDLKVGE